MSNNYVRSAASYRQEARIALKGKWEAAIVVGLILALISGLLFGASVNYSFSTEDGYSTLDVNLGPYFSQTYWNGDWMIGDLADEIDPSEIPGLVPFSQNFLWSALAFATVLLILQPFYQWGLARLSLYPHIAQPITPSLLKIGWHEYWKMVGAQIRVSLSIIWLPLLILLTSILLGILLDARFIIVLAAVAAIVLLLMRAFYYMPVNTLLALCPEKSNREILSDSRLMMKGYRGRYFCLGLSFFGWALLEGVAVSALSSITSIPGIPLIVVSLINAAVGALNIPLLIYLQTAYAAFFLDRMDMSSWQEPTEESEGQPQHNAQSDEPALTQEQYNLLYGTPDRRCDDDRSDRDDDRRDEDDRRNDRDDRDDGRFDRDDRDDDRFQPICYDDGSDSPSDDSDGWPDSDDSSSDDDSSGPDDD